LVFRPKVPIAFGYEANRDLVLNPSLTLLLHATVREIVLAGSGARSNPSMSADPEERN
jgi:hypothetical protein